MIDLLSRFSWGRLLFVFSVALNVVQAVALLFKSALNQIAIDWYTRVQARRERRRKLLLDLYEHLGIFDDPDSEAAGEVQAANRVLRAMLHERWSAIRPQRSCSIPSSGFRTRLHKSIPDDSCVYRALETGEVETAEESWGMSGLPPCRVEAMSMPPGDDAEASLRAVALLSI